MNETSFVRRVAQQNKKELITQRVYTQVLKELLSGIQSELAAGRNVRFLGFDTFYTRIRKASKARHFKTNKVMNVPALRISAFRPGSLFTCQIPTFSRGCFCEKKCAIRSYCPDEQHDHSSCRSLSLLRKDPGHLHHTSVRNLHLHQEITTRP